ncbi:MAG TPA: carboxypeptidase-like regulatory domain-containing protein, partial [Polyangiaceae bacterium]|nr:carboxypeptidase-like regulatory domain-containing protein [Polyangiaceae bacterium]
MKSIALFNLSSGAIRALCAALCAISIVACGDDDQTPTVTTVPAADGGGVSGGPLMDTLTVYAIDSDSNAPIAGADVWLGAGQSAHKVGQTGSDGKLVVSSLDGSPQMLTVSAAGYAAASWGLVKSAVAQIPLESMASNSGTATISLSLPGWDDLPAPAAGNYRIARFAFSRPRGLEALEATLASAAPDCKETADAPASCSATLTVPADSTAVLAVIAEGSDAGTPDDPSDDQLSVTGLGIETGLSLHNAITMALSMPLMDRTSLAPATLMTVNLGDGAFDDVIGVPGISLDSQLLLYPSLGSASTSFLVPTASGAFVNAKLWAVATANDGGGSGWSRVYERGIDPPEDSTDAISLATTAFIASPTVTKMGTSDYALTSDGNLQRLEFATPSGERLNALLFPTQSEFQIPAGVLSEEPNSVTTESFDLEVDLTSF